MLYTKAQQISGMVKDGEGKPVVHATVSLLQVPDTILIKNVATGKEGSYGFEGVPKGRYVISVSYIGYLTKQSAPVEITGSAEVTVPQLTLIKGVANLQGVTVNSKKPMIEVRADKIIVNVENTINAVGNDALELLRKSPGVLVDKDDNLSLSGKNGVQVYIDGRPSPLSGKDLSDYLKTIQSAQVESIELISNPSAKYEAAGNAGIINIRLKKNKAYGTNGSVTAGYNIGTYPKYNGGVSLNHRNQKFNYFGNYNYNRSRNESFVNIYRTQLDSIFDQKGIHTSNDNSHGFKVGLDYYANARNTLGVIVSGNLNSNYTTLDSRTIIGYKPTGVTDRLLEANNTIDGKRNNVNTNLNYRYTDTTGRELNLDADYGVYRISTDQYQPNVYYNPSHTSVISSVAYNMISPSNINTYALKGDYEQNFKKGKLGFGGKLSYVTADNDFQRYNVITSTKVMDSSRSNVFNYKENINAAYVNYNRQYKGIMVQVGARVENTNAKGVSDGHKWTGNNYTAYDSGFTRHYTDLFPSAAVTFNKNSMSQWTFTYSRRIDRPAYQDLNPFEVKLDEYTYMKGNTELKPQYTNSIGVTHMYKYKLTTALNYSHVSDVFTQLVDTADKSKAFMTKKNLADQDVVSLNISMPVQIKRFSSFINMNSNYSHYKADFGTGRTINLDVFNVSMFAQNSFKFTKDLTGEVTGFYSSPSIYQGTFKTRSMWGVDAGVQQTIMQGKATIKATVSDIFLTMRWKATSDFAGQVLNANGGWESRLLKLSFSYRFGNSQVKAARQRKTASEEENKRVNSAGGGLGGGN
jgi:hypothetical protein